MEWAHSTLEETLLLLIYVQPITGVAGCDN